MNKKVVIGLTVFFVINLFVLGYFYFIKYDILLSENLQTEIHSQVDVNDFLGTTKNASVINEKIDTSKLGEMQINAKIKTKVGIVEYKFNITVVDTEKPEIKYPKEIKIYTNEKVNLLKDVKVTDNSKEVINAKVEGNYNITKPGTYKLKFVAIDSSNNKAEEYFNLIVNEKPKPKPKIVIPQSYDNKPYITINRKQNVVMVYDGNNKLLKTFVCSTGKYTPIGTFYTTDKYVWKILIGNVYGQYSTRITGSILFHSVPYYKKTKDSLEYHEYNRLGNKASLGCVRLTVIDAKWIYDNLPLGTKVIIYDSDSLGGIVKPTAPKIDVNSPNRGWDPTDPDPNNPWK